MRTARLMLIVSALWLVGCSTKLPDSATHTPPPITEAATHTVTQAPTPTMLVDAPAPTALPVISVTDEPAVPPRQLLYYAAPSPDDRLIATVDDRGVQVYDATSFAVLWRAPLPDLSADQRLNQIHIAWTDDSAALNVVNTSIGSPPTTESTGILSRFAAQSGELLWHHRHEDRPYLTFAPDGDHFVAVAWPASAVEMWNASTQQQTGSIALAEERFVSTYFFSNNFSPDSAYITGKLGTEGAVIESPSGGLTGENPTYDPELYVWDATTGAQVAALSHPQNLPAKDIFLSWSQDGTMLVSTATGRIIFWDTSTWELRNEIYVDEKYNLVIPYLTRDGKWLFALTKRLTTSGEVPDIHEISRWHLGSLQELGISGALREDIAAGWSGVPIGWLADGHTLLIKVASDVYMLNVETGENSSAYLLPDYDSQVWANPIYEGRYFTVSADGLRIYALTPESVVVYDALTGETLAELRD